MASTTRRTDTLRQVIAEAEAEGYVFCLEGAETVRLALDVIDAAEALAAMLAIERPQHPRVHHLIDALDRWEAGA